MSQPVLHAIGRGAVHVVDAAQQRWQRTANPGLELLPVRDDQARGLFLGLVRFAPLARSGMHQHEGVATSFVVDGGLTDYQGALELHEAGINVKGSTHDAFAYRNTLLVSRLEAPVAYLPDSGELTGLHAGSHHARFVNPAPDMPCDVNVAVDRLAHWETGVPGVRRQMIFDYAGTGSAHRFVQLTLKPGAVVPAWRAGALTEFWVRGGVLAISAGGTIRTAHANCFVVVEPDARIELASPYGALLLGWAEGAEQWVAPPEPAGAARAGLFGY